MHKPIWTGAKTADLGLYFQKSKTLVLADPHLGMESALILGGTLLPKSNFKQIFQRLAKSFAEIEQKGKIETIVITGDLKHSFGPANAQEWNEILDFLEYLKKHCNEIVLLKGNHDVSLGPVARWQNLKVTESFFLEKEKVLVLHGDHLPKAKEVMDAQCIVIGHEHPSITLHEGNRAEKYKCFLKGEWKGRALIVLPSLLQLSEGSDVLNQKHLSPFLKGSLEEFEAWLVEGEKTFYFGKVKNLL
ncbi:MAG: metallophosphoesterase [Candidatus Diapherotrites archaeon]